MFDVDMFYVKHMSISNFGLEKALFNLNKPIICNSPPAPRGDEAEIFGKAIDSLKCPAIHTWQCTCCQRLFVVFVFSKQWCYSAPSPKLRDCTDIHTPIMAA